jgi:hypothetical protein
MSYQDPPRRQRLSRYSALSQYEDGYSSYQDTQAGYDSGTGYQDGHQGFAGLAGAPEQRAPWDDPQQSSSGTGSQGLVQDSGAMGPVWGTGGQRAVRNTGAQSSVQDSGAQGSIWDTAAQRALRNSGAQQAAWDSQAQMTSWDTPAQQAGWEVPRGSGEFAAAADDIPDPAQYAAGRRARRGGLLPGALVGFLAAAVALGVANLVAAFVRPQASPIIAVGEAFIDRTPPALKNFAVQKFGENDKNMLLLGMYVTIALIAIVIGMLAWRRVSLGVAGIGLFGLFGAFVAITRPESHATDVIPSVIGGIAGITVLVWLVRVAMPKRRYRAGWSS